MLKELRQHQPLLHQHIHQLQQDILVTDQHIVANHLYWANIQQHHLVKTHANQLFSQ